MVSKKLTLASGLIVASLSLSGCGSLQSAINNKIASTAQQVGTAVNSEVAKTTDALKQEVGYINMNDLKAPLFLKYYGDFQTGKIKQNEAMSTEHSMSGDAGLKEKFGLINIKELTIDDCPPNPDGVCGATFILYAKSADWNKPGKQTFYFSPDGGGAPGSVYGPFTDDLDKFYNEIKGINNIHIDTVAAK